ncbi:hypothetical protein FRC11_009402 [Ceratobasidium sp. 423]|nr:hypothetical protein FRC11_009402 [Ceratobasidium sp. 423]
MSISDEETMTHFPEGGLLVASSQTHSTATGRQMNHRAIPPINKLPAEILADIIRIVVYCAPCCKEGGQLTSGPVLRYPDVLSHVCSHWRQVAVHSRDLWSHIDIAAWATSGSRAMTFLDRAGQSSLRFHLVAHLDLERQGSENPVDLVPFLAPIMSQLESPEFTPRINELIKTHTSALSICLAACTAGNLTELVIRIIDGNQISGPIFIKARVRARHYAIETAPPIDEIGPWPIWVDMNIPEEHLEDILRGITVLRLCQVYPRWTSSAYCGLVELRLLAGALPSVKIAESQLVDILRSSPKLRILHFNLRITDVAELDIPITDPIALRDLEVLNLDWMQASGIEIFLRWLAPAPKLSQFSLHLTDNETDFGYPATEAFLVGSNITMVHTNYLYLRETVGLIRLYRHIRVLALENVELETMAETIPFRFNTLYLIKSYLYVDNLRRLIQSSSVQRLIVYDSIFFMKNGLILPLDQIPAALFDVCSDVSILPDDDPYPIARWEVFWHK